MTQHSVPDHSETVRKLVTRLDEMKDGTLQMPVTFGPVFVLLALATGHDASVRPVYGACDAAAQALCVAQPGGYVITKQSRRSLPPRTFGSDFPDGAAPRYAYVHVAEHGMVEIVAGGIADNAYGLVGLGAITKSIREHDAEALRAAFDALGVDGPLMVAVALLRTRGTPVVGGGTPEDAGVLGASYVTIDPHRFASRLALDAENLNRLVNDLWTKVSNGEPTA